MKEQTAIYAIEFGKSLTAVSKELGINLNTLCLWVRDYKEAQGIIDNSNTTASSEQMYEKIKELERQLKEKDKTIAEKQKEIDDEKECLLKKDISKQTNHG